MSKIAINILLFLIVIAISLTQPSYAYWASEITPATSTSSSVVTISDWADSWEHQVFYTADTWVLHNGLVYIARKPSMNKEPGEPGSKRFWVILENN